MPDIPKNILALLDLAGSVGARPLDRLKRGKPIEQGREAVPKLILTDLPNSKDSKTLLYLQAILYLYFDCFDEAHGLVNDIEGPVENWIHAIAHRREPDPSNSKYWYRKVSVPKEVYFSIGQKVVDLALSDHVLELELLGAKVAKAKTWVPEAFVDTAERFREKDPSSEVHKGLARIQMLEWQGLLGFILSQ